MSFIGKVRYSFKIFVLAIFTAALAYGFVFTILDKNITYAWIEMVVSRYGVGSVFAVAVVMFFVFKFEGDLEATEKKEYNKHFKGDRVVRF